MKNKAFPLTALFLVSCLLPGCTGQTKKNSSSILPDTSSSSEPSETVSQTYTLTLNPCNGGASEIQRVTGKKGDKVNLDKYKPSNFSNKVFAGWSTSYLKTKKMGDSSKAVSGSYTFGESNQVLYAYYNEASSHTDSEIDAYMNQLKENSVANHLYYHYYRFNGGYQDWDVWAWAYKPDAGEGAKHDWIANGVDDFGGAYVDIDLKYTYKGGWDANTKQFLNLDVVYDGAEEIGLQIVRTETRQTGGGFWVNDGSNLYISLADYAMDLPGGGKAYHVFVVQDAVQEPKARPVPGASNPFEDDDGTNTTYGNDKYDNVNWGSTTAKEKTSTDFKGVGVGYQIMVSSFADSDGDGFGDIYGITNKLDYLQKLGVKALWLTPVQLSDSYHGYDITDYEKVDPKFGSKVSPAAIANGGKVDTETALADYQQLINEAHAKGMKIVMDLVLNHTSTSNKWFVKSGNLDDEYRGYYQWGNHKSQSSIKEENNWYQYGDHPYSYYAKFGSSMPELNFSYKTTREAVEDMSVYWTKNVGVDGFRLDAVKHIYMDDETSTRSGDTIVLDISASGNYSSNITKNLHFFRELKSVVSKESGKEVFFVGENFDGHAYHVAPYYEAFDSMFDFYAYFNLTSAAATGRFNTTSKFGTASGWLEGTSPYQPALSGAKQDVKNSAAAFSVASGKAWNFPTVYKTYNEYRGDVSLPGLFTSNHDIARVINRIAGGGTTNGLDYQGNITTSNYDSFEQSANCVKIAEMLLPGLTWIYYGDEIGMTGNFPTGKDAKSDYADLYYRQPMKWTADQTGEYMTDYYVTGSNMKVGWDEINASSKVVPANTQMNQDNSQFGILSKFVKMKTAGDAVAQTLILGSLEKANFAYGNNAANVLCFTRKYNDTTIKVAVNFNGESIGGNSLEGTVLASYNNPSNNRSQLPPYSVIVVKQ